MHILKFSLRIGIVLCVFLAGLGCAEFILWTFKLPPYPNRCVSRLYTQDIETGFVFKPDTLDRVSTYEYQTEIKINSLGLRDDEYPLTSYNPIFTLGDSFTEGRGVNINSSFSKLMETKLNMPVANLGLSSIGTREEVILLKRYLTQFTSPPELVILFFYLGNDYYDNNGSLKGPMNSASNGYLVGQGQSIEEEGNLVHVLNEKGERVYTYRQDEFQPPIRTGMNWMDQRKIYNILANTLYAFNFSRRIFIRLKMAEIPKYSLPVVIPGLFDGSFDWEKSEDWKHTKKYLDEFIRICEGVRAQPMIVIIPAVCQVDPSLVKKYPPYRDPSTLQADASANILLAYSAQEGIPCVNLLDEFRKLSVKDRRKLYYKADTHWTAYGHDVVATLISGHIHSHRLVKS